MSSNLKVNTILPSTGSNIGIGTNGGELNVDGGCKVQVGTALTLGHSIGLQYATQNLHSTGFEINQINASGIITASQFKGDGSQLTGISAGTSLSGSTNNTVCTVTGANAIQGEANLTFSGSLLSVTGNISLPDSTAPDYVGNIYVGNNSDLKIFHNGSDNFIRSGAGNAKIRIDNNSGVLGARFIPAGAAELYHNGTKMCETSTNGLAFPSGKGVDFSAASGSNAGSSSAVLDDYEEGSYTANFEVTSGSANFHNNTLHYVKIGSMCYVHGEIGTNSKNNPGGDLRFDLPFTSKASGSNMDGHARGLAGAIWNYYGSSNPYGNYGWYPLHIQLNSNMSNNVILYIVGYNSQNSNWGPIGNLIGSGAQIGISFTYRTA